MAEPNSLVVIAIVLTTLVAIFLVLRAVTVWAAPPSTGPRRPLPMFTSPEAVADVGTGPDGDGGHGGDATGYGGH